MAQEILSCMQPQFIHSRWLTWEGVALARTYRIELKGPFFGGKKVCSLVRNQAASLGGDMEFET